MATAEVEDRLIQVDDPGVKYLVENNPDLSEPHLFAALA